MYEFHVTLPIYRTHIPIGFLYVIHDCMYSCAGQAQNVQNSFVLHPWPTAATPSSMSCTSPLRVSLEVALLSMRCAPTPSLISPAVTMPTAFHYLDSTHSAMVHDSGPYPFHQCLSRTLILRRFQHKEMDRGCGYVADSSNGACKAQGRSSRSARHGIEEMRMQAMEGIVDTVIVLLHYTYQRQEVM